ncbi:MAG TPA: TIGR01458 family HAD-type hydrolase [Candidatus Polarisedimenticolia bacterium]|nr:TIGR01458 family HAD-type hydrolase [Candidatus Polarisedimenticolia bacterium]
MAEREIKGLLIDIDGVVYDDEEIIPDSVYAIRWLQQKRVPFRFATNATSRSRASLVRRLGELGIEVTEDQVVNTPYVAAQELKRRPQTRCMLLLKEDARREFEGMTIVDRDPHVVVVGDLASGFDYATLNRAFQAVLGGAEILALQKDRFWKARGELVLDAGPFVVALEYATGRKARLIGKPSRDFFRVALEGLGVPAEQVAMIGDDVENDVRGAQEAGLMGILVQTGKYRKDLVERSGILPDRIVKNLGDLVAIF